MSVHRIATLRGVGLDFTLSTIEGEEETVQSHLMDLAGWFGGVGVSGDSTQRELGHGLFKDRALRAGRALTLEGLLLFQNERDRLTADRFVSGLLWDGEFGELEVTTGDLTLTCEVRLDGEISHAYEHETRGMTVQIPLMAPDPFLYAPPRSYQIYPAGHGEGLRWPLFADEKRPGVLSFGNAAPNTRLNLTNQGNATAHPTIRIHGSFPSGFRITEGARTIEYPSPVWPEAPVEINCAEGAVYVDGRDATYRCSRRDWFEIPAGAALAPRISALQPGDGWAEFIVRDTYI